MKKTLFIAFLLLVSCSPSQRDKPENVISEQKMAQVIFELSVINASKGFRPADGAFLNYANTSFFDHHGIDSLQFALSNAYYAARPKVYLKIVERAEQLLETHTDSLVGTESIKKLDPKKVQVRSPEKNSKSNQNGLAK